MWKHGFDMHRVFLSAPGDLSADREAVRSAIAKVNQDLAMPERILLVAVGLPDDDQIVGYRAAVAQNIRESAYFVQIFQDDWGPKNLFRKMFYLALECRDDAALPMSEAIILLKDAPHESEPEVLAFRKELEDHADVRIFRYRKPEELAAQLAPVFEAWVQAIRGQPQHAAGAAASE